MCHDWKQEMGQNPQSPDAAGGIGLDWLMETLITTSWGKDCKESCIQGGPIEQDMESLKQGTVDRLFGRIGSRKYIRDDSSKALFF